MIKIDEIEGGDWLDEHRTCDRRALRVFKVRAEASGDPTANLAADLAERSERLGALMDDLAAQPHPVAITGSAWSQADLFASPAVRVDTAMDKAVWAIPEDALAPDFAGDADRYVVATGGAKLYDIMRFLDARGLSLRTAGSHNGQSIAGAIATGTHGSVLGEAGLERHVRGILFIGGSGARHWIADPDCPVLSEAFIQGFATPADPALFHDAVIHLGGLGYCAAVLLEGVPRFGLSWKKTIAPLAPSWWDAVARADYKSAAAPLIGEETPAFYELTFDPNSGLDADVMQTVYWRDPLPEPDLASGPPDPSGLPPQAPARDALDLVTDAINSFSQSMVASRSAKDEDDEDDRDGGFLSFARRLRLLDIAQLTFDDFRKDAAQRPLSNQPESLVALTGDWQPREVFGIRIDTFNAALSVPVAELRRALEIGTTIAADWRKHFVFTVRFAKRSRARLSFLRFEDTAIINIDGLTRAGIAGWISHSDEFSRAFTKALEKAGVPFSMHWGKDIESDADKIAADFGEAAARYKAARAQLVPEGLREKLCPPMLQRWGLA
ncbi:MAG: FAD-binding protein [Pseudomonadota bacterium]